MQLAVLNICSEAPDQELEPESPYEFLSIQWTKLTLAQGK
jgi:hypothetical protein